MKWQNPLLFSARSFVVASLLPALGCYGPGTLESAGSGEGLKVAWSEGLPNCASLSHQREALCGEARRISLAGGAHGANGVPLAYWQGRYTSDLTWLGEGRCASTLEEALSLAAKEGDFGEGVSPQLTRINEPYERGIAFTLREANSQRSVRVPDCASIASFQDPAALEGEETVEALFVFSRDLAAPELFQLLLEVETHQNSDARASSTQTEGPLRSLIALGAEEPEPGALFISCAFGPTDARGELIERRYIFDAQRQTVDYTATLLATLDCVE